MILTINVKQLTYGGVISANLIPLTINAGGIVVGASTISPFFTNSAASNSYAVTLTNNTAVDIEINQSGFHPYKVTIDNLYNENISIDIVLGQVLPLNSAPYGKVASNFFKIEDPCSFKVDYYKACSTGGNSSWYLNNILYITGTKAKFNFGAPTTAQVKHVVDVPYSNINPAQATFVNITGSIAVEGYLSTTNLNQLLGSDMATNLTVAEYRPDLSLAFTTPNKPVPSTNLSCFATGEVITITPTWTLNRPGAVANNHNIVYTITGPDGLTVLPNNTSGSPQGTFPLSTTPANATVTFTLSKLGTYKVSAKIVDTHCSTEFPIEYCVETCKFINIKYKSCNIYTIENKSTTENVVYSIEQHGVVGTVATGILNKKTNVDITFSNPGLFIMTATYGAGVTEKYIISNHCEVEKCITSYITDLLCGGGDPCSPCPEDNELNQMLLMSYTYFMKLNKEYALNNFYTGLSQEKLDELTSISGVLNKMSLFCSRRKCSDTSFSEGTNTNGPVNNWSSSKSGGCGCNSTNTASTNVNTSSSGCGCS